MKQSAGFRLALVSIVALGAMAAPAAATIINGDFATGDFTGWTVQAFQNNFAGAELDSTPFVDVVNGPNGNYARVRTGNFDIGNDGNNTNDLGSLQIGQRLFIDADRPVLGIDVWLISAFDDPTGAANSASNDAFFIDIWDFLLYRQTEAAISPDFGGIGGFRNIPVTLGTPIDPLFDTRVFFDLDPFFTQPFFADDPSRVIQLELLLLQFNDGRQTSFGFGNIAFEARSGSGSGTGAVPEPGSWALMIAGFGLIGAARRIRRNRGVTA